MKKIIVLLLLPITLFAFNETVDNTTLYNKALGGPHTGMVKGFDTFFNNPALFADYKPEISIFDLTVNMMGDSLDLINLYFGDQLTLEDPQGVLTTLEDQGLTSLLIGADIGGPLSIGKIGNNWGWSLKNSSNLYLNLPGLTSTATVIAREDFQFSAGIAFPFKIILNDSFFIKLVPGVLSRTTIRTEIDIESDLLGIMGMASDFASILDTYPINVSPMFAVDCGFNISFNDVFRFTGVVKDLYTPILKYPVSQFSDAFNIFTTTEDTTGNLVYREINLGLSGDIPLGFLSIIISDLNLYLDYFDLLDFDKNILLHFGAGADLELLNKFHILGGVNEGLLSLGLNVDLGGFDIGFAMYGTEESSQPGVQSTFNFLLSIGISF